MKYFLFVLLFLPVLRGNACLNEVGINLDGDLTEIDFYEFINHPTATPDQNQIDKRLKALRKELAESKEVDNDDIHTNIGAYMIYDGDYQGAIDYLRKNVVKKFSNYNYCSNIGVAFELVGDLDSALFYTKRGLELHPDSHEDSEWIHVRILEVEIALKQNANWLATHNIFEFALSKDSVPTVFPRNFYFEKFSIQLSYQLHERTFFVKPVNQDPVVAQLLLILADANVRGIDVEKSFPTYLLAAEYDTTLTPIVNKRLAYLQLKNPLLKVPQVESDKGLNSHLHVASEETIEDATKQPKKVIKNIEYYLLAGFFLLLVVLYFFLRKKK